MIKLRSAARLVAVTILIGFSFLRADTDRDALGKLTARIGDRFCGADGAQGRVCPTALT